MAGVTARAVTQREDAEGRERHGQAPWGSAWRDSGFTLIELLVTILIIGILVAVGVPLYLGYTKEARLSEGKALIGSTITAAQACAQSEPTTGCSLERLRNRVGLTTTNTTGDGKWMVSIAGGPLTLDTSNGKFGPPAVIITAAGQTGSVASIAVTATSDASGTFSLRCNVSGNSAATNSDPAC